jgi:hypothetical protein
MNVHNRGTDSALRPMVELEALRRSIDEDLADEHRPTEAGIALDAWRDVELRWRDADEGSAEKMLLAGELTTIRQRYLDVVAEQRATMSPTRQRSPECASSEEAHAMLEDIRVREPRLVDAEFEPPPGEPNLRSRFLARLEGEGRVDTLTPEMATHMGHIQKSLTVDPEDEAI